MKAERESRNELDAMVVNIELTLVSIIQGVALSFLAENARVALAGRLWTAAPYVLAGLLIILLFWSRSLIHTLTLIRWPLEFGHNFFLYHLHACSGARLYAVDRSVLVVCFMRGFFGAGLGSFYLRHAHDSHARSR